MIRCDNWCVLKKNLKKGIWSGESCELESRKKKKKKKPTKNILSYHPLRSKHISLSSLERLQYAAWSSFSKVEAQSLKKNLINSLPTAFCFFFHFLFKQSKQRWWCLSVWDQVSECILPGCDRAGFNSHLFLRKFVSPGRRARGLNSELPEGILILSLRIISFLQRRFEAGGAWTERDLRISALV